MPSETTRLPPRNSAQFRKPTGDFQRENSRDRKPFRPKPWSHQQDLTAAKGKRVEIDFAETVGFTGVLLEADQFSLKVEVSNPDGTYKSVLTVFKHSIRHYRVV
jgi:hypothetical protein